MLAVQGTMNTLFKKVTTLETNFAKSQEEKLPFDIERLNNKEINTRREIMMALENVDSHKESLEAELKRLRREHLNNVGAIDKIKEMFTTNSKKISSVLERQSLNDMAMATMFKVMKIDIALENQDETDKKETYLMGKTNGNDYVGPQTSRIDGGNSRFMETSINLIDDSICSSGSRRVGDR